MSSASFQDASQSSDATAGGVVVAKHPFDNSKHSADTILRSTDNMYFYVHAQILVQASSVFMKKLSSKLSSDSKKRKRSASEDDDVSRTDDGTPLVHVPASSRVLRDFLLHIYPAPRPKPGPDTICSIVRLATTYQTQYIKDAMVDAFVASAAKDPFLAYTAAIANSWKKGAQIAARASLSLPMLTHPLPSHMENIRVGDLSRLQEYHTSCANAAVAVIESWEPKKYSIGWGDEKACWYSCPSRGSYDYGTPNIVDVMVGGKKHRAGSWWVKIVEGLLDALDASPSRSTIFNQDLLRRLCNVTCHDQCRQNAPWDLLQFAEELGDRVEKAVSRIVLELKN